MKNVKFSIVAKKYNLASIIRKHYSDFARRGNASHTVLLFIYHLASAEVFCLLFYNRISVYQIVLCLSPSVCH